MQCKNTPQRSNRSNLIRKSKFLIVLLVHFAPFRDDLIPIWEYFDFDPIQIFLDRWDLGIDQSMNRRRLRKSRDVVDTGQMAEYGSVNLQGIIIITCPIITPIIIMYIANHFRRRHIYRRLSSSSPLTFIGVSPKTNFFCPIMVARACKSRFPESSNSNVQICRPKCNTGDANSLPDRTSSS